MKREAEIKVLLVENAIHLIGTGGFEKATTKEMTYCRGHLPDFKMNEIYIYRLFGNKEKLYEAAFVCLDTELERAFSVAVDALGDFSENTEERLLTLFSRSWEFLLNNEERCRCYLRYYYSVYFKGAAVEAHNRLFGEIVSRMSPLFTEEADVLSILHSVFMTLLDFAIRVYNGELEDNDINRPHIYKMLYNMMSDYLKPLAA